MSKLREAPRFEPLEARIGATFSDVTARDHVFSTWLLMHAGPASSKAESSSPRIDVESSAFPGSGPVRRRSLWGPTIADVADQSLRRSVWA